MAIRVRASGLFWAALALVSAIYGAVHVVAGIGELSGGRIEAAMNTLVNGGTALGAFCLLVGKVREEFAERKEGGEH